MDVICDYFDGNFNNLQLNKGLASRHQITEIFCILLRTPKITNPVYNKLVL